jgi:hypothetical protein
MLFKLIENASNRQPEAAVKVVSGEKELRRSFK